MLCTQFIASYGTLTAHLDIPLTVLAVTESVSFCGWLEEVIVEAVDGFGLQQ